MGEAYDEIEVILNLKANALIRRDEETLRNILNVNFTYINANGDVFNKEDYIKAYCTSGSVIFIDQKIKDMMMKLFNGFAICTMIINDTLMVKGVPVLGNYFSLSVFSLEFESWQWVAGQTVRRD